MRMIWFSFLLALLAVFFQKSECADSFTQVGNKFLRIVDQRIPFDAAEKKCQELGSRLVEIWSEDEWNQVYHGQLPLQIPYLKTIDLLAHNLAKTRGP